MSETYFILRKKFKYVSSRPGILACPPLAYKQT